MDARIEVKGAKELRRALRLLGDKELTQELKQAHKAAGEVVAETARSLVPARTGRLRASIKSAAVARGVKVVAGGGKVLYAGPIHFGWPTRPNKARGWRGGPIRPQPFLYDAADRRIADVVGIYQLRINSIVERVNSGG